MSIENVCDLIIIVGSAYFTIIKIIESFGKPTSKLKARKKQKYKEEQQELLDELMPKYFREHDQQIQYQCSANGDKCYERLKNDVYEEIHRGFNELKEENSHQNEQLEILKEGTKDILRQRIMTIYREYRKEKAFPIFIKEALDELYKVYKKQGGNSYIDKYYKRMQRWKVFEESDF